MIAPKKTQNTQTVTTNIYEVIVDFLCFLVAYIVNLNL